MTGIELLHQWGPLAGGAMAAIPPYLKLWQASRRDRDTLVQIASDAAGSQIGRLEAEIDRHQRALARLQEETDACHERGLEKERRIAELEAEVGRLRSDLNRHERQSPGLAIPKVRVVG